VAGLLIAPLVTGCVENKSAADNNARNVQQQKAFNDAAIIHQAILPAVGTDPELTEYIQLIGARLLTGARQSGATIPGDVHFLLVTSPSHNVIAPGGLWIYITTGLLQQCSTEDDAAAALAHGLAQLFP
jgi:predicted Zn-dependent protease